MSGCRSFIMIMGWCRTRLDEENANEMLRSSSWRLEVYDFVAGEQHGDLESRRGGTDDVGYTVADDER